MDTDIDGSMSLAHTKQSCSSDSRFRRELSGSDRTSSSGNVETADGVACSMGLVQPNLQSLWMLYI